jgi:hypothetical protein
MDEIVYGWKLFRLRKDGTIGPLFINRKLVVTTGVWHEAENHPTPGFAVHPGWHATPVPHAPHLKMQLANGERRVWIRVALQGVVEYPKPEVQGGVWLLAKRLKVVTD